MNASSHRNRRSLPVRSTEMKVIFLLLLASVLALAQKPAPPQEADKCPGAQTTEIGAGSDPIILECSVPGDTNRVFHVRFKGGIWGTILLTGDGKTDLDLIVTDHEGHVVAVDNDGADLCLARWFIAQAGEFKIEVRNLGDTPNQFRIVCN